MKDATIYQMVGQLDAKFQAVIVELMTMRANYSILTTALEQSGTLTKDIFNKAAEKIKADMDKAREEEKAKPKIIVPEVV